MDYFDLIENALAKPYKYTCGESLSALRSFIQGYIYCSIENEIIPERVTRYELLPAQWLLFTDYVRCSLTYDEPDADWFDILMTYFGDKEGYRMFVNYFDSYRRLKVTSYKSTTLNEGHQNFYKLCIDEDNVPLSFYIAELDRGSCYVAATEFEDKVCQTIRIYKTEEQAFAEADEYFGGDFSWFGVTGVDRLTFKKPVEFESF